MKKRIQQKTSGATVHRSVTKDVEKMLENKTFSELELLQVDIYKRLQQANNNKSSSMVDRNYWEEILFEIKYHRSCNNVRLLNERMIKFIFNNVKNIKKQIQEHKQQQQKQGEVGHGIVEDKKHDGSIIEDHNNIENLEALYDIQQESNIQINDGDDHHNTIETQQHIKGTSSSSSTTNDLLDNEHEENMKQSDEIQLPQQNYNWSDKYRPRKPRYFNRVRTGWDWNKYNKTHYDHDNPPPKTIQGYKFAIFFPDLIDITNTPKYFLEGTGDGNRDFAIIRFHSGPPYEDIAFKIVNKEWDKDRRSGFKCQFEKGVLTLNFNFKRIFYRR